MQDGRGRRQAQHAVPERFALLADTGLHGNQRGIEIPLAFQPLRQGSFINEPAQKRADGRERPLLARVQFLNNGGSGNGRALLDNGHDLPFGVGDANR